MGAKLDRSNEGSAMNKPYTIIVKNLDGWWSACCPQLHVSGFGASKQQAINSVVTSIRSTLSAQVSSLREDQKNIKRMAEFQTA